MVNPNRFPSAFVVTILGVTGSVTPLQAQTNTPPMLEEVIVTAEKRSENLQDVPASLAAFGAEEIEEAGWLDINRLQEAVPSLVIGGESKNRTYISIRGIGTRKFDIGTDSSVGMFVDEVYVARFSSALTGIMDIERIEVLKGPQGTLYGRNTIGGAISIITREPSEEFEARVKASVGNNDFQQYSGNVSGALAEDLLGRLSLSTTKIDGIYEDTVSGNDNNDDTDAARLSLRYNLNDTWQLTATADYSEVKSDAVLTDIVPGDVFPIVLVPPNDERVEAIVAAGEEDRYENGYTHPGFVDRTTEQYSFKAKAFWEPIDFLSITSYSTDDYDESRDFDGTVLDAWTHGIEQNSDQFSQEFRFSSTANGFATFDNRLQWVVGFYYFEDDAERKDNHSGGQDTILNPPELGVETGYSLFDITVDTTSYAFYGQGTYALTANWNLTLGLRHTDDEKDYSYAADTNVPTPPIATPFQVSDRLNFNSTDPTVILDYHFDDNIMVYASYAKGYKSGGVQFGVTSPEQALDSFDEERLRSIEIGIKSRLLNERLQLNASAYNYDFKDQQLQQIISVDGAPVGITENAATSDMNGIEVELLTLLTDGLTLDIKYAWQDAKFDDFVSEEGDYSGNSMPAAPDNAYSIGLTQRMPVGEYGDIALLGNYAWKDDQYFNFRNDDLARQDAYGVYNLSAIWNLWDNHTRLRVFCDNCGDEEYLLNFTGFPALFGGGRNTWNYGRLYGAEITYEF